MRKIRIYYGWVLVTGLSIVGAVNMSLGGVNYGSFIAPMRNDLGISSTVFGLSATARTLATGICSPYLGRLLDKHGSRIPLAIAGVLVMVCLCGLALVNAGWQLMLLMAFLGAIGMQGGQSLYSAVPISQWFIRKRGQALSMAFLGGPIALLITLPGTAWLIEEIGWRWTWAALGIGGGLTVIAVALLIVRHSPQEMGLQPDGFAPEQDEGEVAAGEAPKQLEEPYEYPWTRREAMRTWAFWSLGLAFGVSQLGAGTFVLFRIPYFEEKGFSPALSGAAAATDALVVVLGLLALGPFIDRLSLRHGGALGVFLTMVALAIALVADTVFLMFFSNFVFGVGQVFNSAVRNVIWSTYYGRANIGSIRGTAFLVQMMFGAAGPPLAGILRDSSGGYELAWLFSLLPMAAGTVLIYFTRPPVPKQQPETTPLAVST